MYRLMGAGLLAISSVVAVRTPVHGAGTSSRGHATVNWNQHDTAVYVVSTLNLFRTRTGRPVSQFFRYRSGVTSFTVLSDVGSPNLYFVGLNRANGSILGTYAYQIGWTRPMAVTSSLAHFGAQMATTDVRDSYHTDRLVALETVTFTLP